MAAISEKDANIALLELSSSKKKKTQDEVALLKREKDRLVQQLKQQVRSWSHDPGARQLGPHKEDGIHGNHGTWSLRRSSVKSWVF